MLNKAVYYIRQGKFIKAFYTKANVYKRNIYNITRYGWSAPRYGELFWVDPSKVNKFLHRAIIEESCGMNYTSTSGLVINSTWPYKQALHITEKPIIKFCIDHWINGIPWEHTGVYEYLTKRQIFNKNQIDKRYKELDLIFEQVKKEGKLRIREESNHSKEYKYGIVSIGPNGEAFYVEGGTHRFAMAYILQIPYPAQIGCVHESAIPYLKEYRKYKISNMPILV